MRTPRLSWILLVLLNLTYTLWSQEMALSGGGSYPSNEGVLCISEQQRIGIRQMLSTNIAFLKSQGITLNPDSRGVQPASFDWPLRKVSALTFASYYATDNFVDHDPGIGTMDYYCGYRTNNGHKGTDFGTWPFPWYMYENNLVEVIAAESGTIVGKLDGNEDNHCECAGEWNAIYIQHDDGSEAWYGHLKRNSLAEKNIGEKVEKGEYLGILASSGCSTDAHLHFEVYDASKNLIDPYIGDCNQLNGTTWWSKQNDYREPTLNAVLIHDSVPVHGCPSTIEDPRFGYIFQRGDPVYMALYFRDETMGEKANLRIKRPDGSTWNAWTHTAPESYTRSWWWWYWYFGAGEPIGTWTFEVDYHGEIFVREFIYIDSSCCLTEGITLSAQSQIDSFSIFYPDCNQILGDVHISESESDNITNLNGFKQITNIHGSLKIINNSALTNLAGLDKIISIGDTLALVNNSGLTSLSGLEQLDYSKLKNLQIQHCNLLGVCATQKICTYLNGGGHAAISGNAIGCSSLEQIQSACANLPSCLSDGVVFNSQGQIDSFPLIFPGCTEILGDVAIQETTPSNIISLDSLSQLTSIGGSLIISNNTSLSNLSGLQNVTSIKDDLEIEFNESLSSLVALSALTSLGGSLKLSYNDALTSLEGLKNISEIKGDLTISGHSLLQNLQGLDHLSSIEGSLVLSGVRNLKDLRGLDSLQWIGADLRFSHLNDLTSLTALGNLSFTGGSVEIRYNNSLRNLKGLDLLDTIFRNFTIRDNEKLVNLSGLEGLTRIFGQMTIASNSSLASLDGLDSIKESVGGLEIQGNFSLNNLEALSNLRSLDGMLSINTNPGLIDLHGLHNVEEIRGNLLISNSSSLQDLLELKSLTSIGGHLSLFHNIRIVNLDGLDSLSHIGGDINIFNNEKLRNLDQLINISSLGRNLSISFNDSLHSIAGLININSIGGRIYLDNNDVLASLHGLDNIDYKSITGLSVQNCDMLSICEIKSICDYLDHDGEAYIGGNARNCNSISSVQAACEESGCLDDGITFTAQGQIDSFPIFYPGCTHIAGDLIIEESTSGNIINLDSLIQIRSIGGSLRIYKNESLNNIIGLKNIRSIGENFIINLNHNLADFRGLNNLNSIGGWVDIWNNQGLVELAGLDSLNSIGDYLFIAYNDALQSLRSLQKLKELGGYLAIAHNSSLINLKGLESLTYIGGRVTVMNNENLISLTGLESVLWISGGLRISNNPVLKNLYALEKLNSVFGELVIVSNHRLTTLKGLDRISSVHGLTILNNQFLTNLYGLDNLRGIGGGLIIQDNPVLSSLNALSSVTTMNGVLTIDSNDSLTSLQGLENINAGGISELIIRNCPNMSFCEITSICEYLENGGSATIEGNAMGCGSLEEVQNTCGASTSYLYDQPWTWQHPLPQGNSLYGLYFIDEQTGWAAGDRGTIIHTQDGGESWDVQKRVTSDFIFDIHFKDQMNGMAATFEGHVLKTTSGGSEWEVIYSNSNLSILKINLLTENRALLLGGQGNWGKMMVTDDGGQSWTEIFQMMGGALIDLAFIDSMQGWTCGTDGKIFQTLNGGLDWDTLISNTDKDLLSIDFVDDSHGWTLGFDIDQENDESVLLNTTNGGFTWQRLSEFPGKRLNWVRFVDKMVGWISGYDEPSNDRILLRTEDGGVTWKKYEIVSELPIYRTFFNDSQTGWMVGDHGLIMKTEDGAKNWQEKSKILTNALLYDVHFVTSEVGWAVGDEILYTADGGITWEVQNTGYNRTWKSVFFVDEQTGWVVGDAWESGILDQFVLHTENGGRDWSQQEIATIGSLESIFFVNETTGWAVGSGGKIFRTSDGGTNWIEQSNDQSYQTLKNVFFLDSNFGWAAGEGNTILRTRNGGDLWESIDLGGYYAFYRLNALFFINDSVGYVVGSKGGYACLIKTTDGGINWSYQYINARYGLSDIFFVDDLEGWIVGNSIWHTVDGGETWLGAPYPHGISDGLNGLHFSDKQNGWAVGSRGIILKYTGETTPVYEEDIPTLSQDQIIIYPNPTDGMIHIYSKNQEKYLAYLMNLSGQTIGKYPAKEYQKIDMSNLQSGVYLVHLFNHRNVFTKKVILTR